MTSHRTPACLLAATTLLAAASAHAADWTLTGNTGTDPAQHFIGTLDARPLVMKANGLEGLRIMSATSTDPRVKVTGGLQCGGGLILDGAARLNDNTIFLRPGVDQFHGLGWYGAGKLFAGVNVDGPVLFGSAGGALGTAPGGKQKAALQWFSDASLAVNGRVKLNDNTILLRNDEFHGLGWYGAGKLFAGVNVDGPVLFGNAGGALGTAPNGKQKAALQWFSDASLAVNGRVKLNDNTIFLRNDDFHGLGWYGAGKLFAGANVDGPVLFGNAGGALGTAPGGKQKAALQWFSDASLAVNGRVKLNDNTILLRSDENHGLGWYGAGKLFAGVDVNGPVLFGNTGGALGTNDSTGQRTVLRWSSDGHVTVAGNVKVVSKTNGGTVAEIGEGLDVAEGFVVEEPEVEPGAVLIIGDQRPGSLALSRGAYDTRVAGVVAGARGLHSGVRLAAADASHDVALAGRVYCNVDATGSAVSPGDLLTTSSIPGYAMPVRDAARAQGAILGKAMEALPRGTRGQILILVTLQ